MSYESNIRLTKDEVKDRIDKAYDNNFPWNEVKMYGITPYAVSQDEELYFALVNRRFTPAMELNALGDGTYFSGGIRPKVSIQLNRQKDGKFSIDVQYVAPKLEENSTVVINKTTSIRPISEITAPEEKHRALEEQRRCLIEHGFCEGTVTVNTEFWDKEARKFNMKSEDKVLGVNPYSNQIVTMVPSVIEAFLFKRKGVIEHKYNGAELSDEQVKALTTGHEILVRDMYNPKVNKYYDGYVRFDVYQKRAVVSDAPTPGTALSKGLEMSLKEEAKAAQAQAAEQEQAPVKKAASRRSR